MRKRFRGFTLIELLVVIAIIALLISILLPSLSRARELSKRLVCGSNTKGIGTSCKIYANDNNERWPVPPFEASATKVDGQGINYTRPGTETAGVGYLRHLPSTSATSTSVQNGSTSLSVTRAFWMLVRSGDVTVQQFICPSSGDVEDTTDNLELYYDFAEYGNISYGYQVPWGPRDTVPREGMDNRAALIADKGPYSAACSTPDFLDPAGADLTQKSGPRIGAGSTPATMAVEEMAKARTFFSRTDTRRSRRRRSSALIRTTFTRCRRTNGIRRVRT